MSPHIPLDLLRTILDYVASDQFLLATFCLVSRDWYHAAVGLLFRYPRLNTRHALRTFSQRLTPAHVPHIVTLRLGADHVNEHVDDRILKRIADAFDRSPHSPNLTTLNLNRCRRITDDGVVPLLAAAGARLVFLGLKYCGHITNRSFITLATHSPQLQCLILVRTLRLQAQCLAPLVTAGIALRHLDLTGCAWVSDDTVLRDVCSLSTLRVLRLSSCLELTGRILGPTARALQELEEVRIATMEEVKDEEIADMVRCLGRGIKKFGVEDVKIGPLTEEAISERLMKLNVLYLRATNGVREEMVRRWIEGGIKNVLWRDEESEPEDM